jgi:E3 ubiquitin-protein ligase UHRF1
MASVPTGDWACPDCDLSPSDGALSQATMQAQQPFPANAGAAGESADLLSQVRAIRADPNLSEQEKARKCQDVMSKKGAMANNGKGGSATATEDKKKVHKMLQIFDENLNCTFCMQLADRPVTVSLPSLPADFV